MEIEIWKYILVFFQKQKYFDEKQIMEVNVHE